MWTEQVLISIVTGLVSVIGAYFAFRVNIQKLKNNMDDVSGNVQTVKSDVDVVKKEVKNSHGTNFREDLDVTTGLVREVQTLVTSMINKFNSLEQTTLSNQEEIKGQNETLIKVRREAEADHLRIYRRLADLAATTKETQSAITASIPVIRSAIQDKE